MMSRVVCGGLILVALVASLAVALDNGLIRTPPMGWLHWERFRCNTDCAQHPNDCISEKLFKDMADRMASDGYREAGYTYVIMDDCWLARTRDAKGRLQPDPQRFPSGIRALADYIHGKNLKYGLYEDIGTKTCAGYPGSMFYMQLDAQTFADWTVDYLKFDGCNIDNHVYEDGYPPMALYLNMTGRPIALSCEYALYQLMTKLKPDYKGQAAACNVARNSGDIDNNWNSVKRVIEDYGRNEFDFASVAGPGYFNDPDMLVIGNSGLSLDQERVQMAVWSILAAPLLMSNDLRNIRPESKAILLNKLAIAIDQDPLGIQGRLINKTGDIGIWTKPILPSGSYAFAVVNLGGDIAKEVSFDLSDLGLTNPSGYNVTEVFDGKNLGLFKPSSKLVVTVNPTGVFFAQATAIPKYKLQWRN